jgi:hypothetical protein
MAQFCVIYIKLAHDVLNARIDCFRQGESSPQSGDSTAYEARYLLFALERDFHLGAKSAT